MAESIDELRANVTSQGAELRERPHQYNAYHFGNDVLALIDEAYRLGVQDGQRVTPLSPRIDKKKQEDFDRHTEQAIEMSAGEQA